MREKEIHEKFHKSTLLPDCDRWRHQSAFVDGHSYTNTGTASFPQKKEGTLY